MSLEEDSVMGVATVVIRRKGFISFKSVVDSEGLAHIPVLSISGREQGSSLEKR